MTVVFWVAAGLLVVLGTMSVFFFVLHLGSGELVPRKRAIAFGRWCVVVVLATFNIWIFNRVIDGIRDLWFRPPAARAAAAAAPDEAASAPEAAASE